MATRTTKTKDHPWDRAAATPLVRQNYAFGQEETIDPGVNFFVEALEALGAKTRFSCEGHPSGFYVVFEAPYELALELKSIGFFSVEIEGQNVWSLRKRELPFDGEREYSESDKVQTLRWAAEVWVRHFAERLASLECLQPARAPAKPIGASKS